LSVQATGTDTGSVLAHIHGVISL